jgi:hypothetical protein
MAALVFLPGLSLLSLHMAAKVADGTDKTQVDLADMLQPHLIYQLEL